MIRMRELYFQFYNTDRKSVFKDNICRKSELSMKALIFVFYQREKHLLQGLHIRGKAKDQHIEESMEYSKSCK